MRHFEASRHPPGRLHPASSYRNLGLSQSQNSLDDRHLDSRSGDVRKSLIGRGKLGLRSGLLFVVKNERAATGARRGGRAVIYCVYDRKLHKIKANQRFILKKYDEKRRFAKE